jgi:hypothetical protein
VAAQCRDPKACTAVGSFFNGVSTVPLADRWNGTKWATQQAAVAETWNGTAWSVLGVPMFGGPPSGLSGVSCSSLTACISVGSDTDTSNREAPPAEQYS